MLRLEILRRRLVEKCISFFSARIANVKGDSLAVWHLAKCHGTSLEIRRNHNDIWRMQCTVWDSVIYRRSARMSIVGLCLARPVPAAQIEKWNASSDTDAISAYTRTLSNVSTSGDDMF